ncbi:MAG: hypothetical protein ACXWLB_13100 [Reyranella sp.]
MRSTLGLGGLRRLLSLGGAGALDREAALARRLSNVAREHRIDAGDRGAGRPDVGTLQLALRHVVRERGGRCRHGGILLRELRAKVIRNQRDQQLAPADRSEVIDRSLHDVTRDLGADRRDVRLQERIVGALSIRAAAPTLPVLGNDEYQRDGPHKQADTDQHMPESSWHRSRRVRGPRGRGFDRSNGRGHVDRTSALLVRMEDVVL